MFFSVPALFMAAALSGQAWANIDLELRPLEQSVVVDGIVEIGLYAVSDDASDQSLRALDAILIWDPVQLLLESYSDDGPYIWEQSFFPDDSALDGLNEPFQGEQGEVPYNDGDAFYTAWANFAGPAYAPPEGLLVTVFKFRALAPGVTTVELLPEYGEYSFTRVLDAVIPGLDITGAIGPPAQVTILASNPDLEDYAAFRSCLTGPENMMAPGCETSDFDGDGDVDLADFSLLQNAFSAP